MMLRWVTTIVLCGAMLLALGNGAQAADGWFGGSKAPATNGVTANSKKSWWPSWSLTSKSKAKPAAKKQSMWGSVTTGTKNTWNKTTSFLNPFDNKPSSSANAPAANSSSWFGTKKESRDVATLPDYIGQPKPQW